MDGLCYEVPLLDSETINVKNLKVGYYIDDGIVKVSVGIRSLIEDTVFKLRDATIDIQQIKPDEVEFGREILIEHYTNDGSLQLKEFLKDYNSKFVRSIFCKRLKKSK